VSTDKEKLNQLLQRVEEITVTLNKVSEELRSVSASLKSIAVGQIIQPKASSTTSPTPTPKPTSAPPTTIPPIDASKLRSLNEIRMSFPEELESRLSFEEKGDYIIIKPTQFLGTNFAKIASAVRGMGGEYISAGKDSHFRVPKKKAQ
jgi:hypothetical protein